MATEQYFQSGEDGSLPQTSATTTWDNLNGCFDCNICLDNAHDPVVTLCGHLYCWPCIYKWLHFQGSSFAPEEQQQCPVCKAGISQTTIVPLYGRGQSSRNEPKDKGPSQSLDIPRRPQACGVMSSSTSTSSPSHNNNNNNHNSYGSRSRSPSHQSYPNAFASPQSAIPTLHPMIGMFGEMVHARVSGNSQGTSLYWYPNAYNHMRTTSSRARRQEMQAEKSLNRVSIFLFCCFVLCLLLF